LFVGSYASADKASVQKDLTAVRAAMVKMREESGDVAALKKEVADLSKKIDAEAGSIPGFKAIWDAYQKTRDQDFIPAFDGTRPADKDKAKALGTGVQKERYEKMLQLLK
jgi:hypothetical protein